MPSTRQGLMAIVNYFTAVRLVSVMRVTVDGKSPWSAESEKTAVAVVSEERASDRRCVCPKREPVVIDTSTVVAPFQCHVPCRCAFLLLRTPGASGEGSSPSTEATKIILLLRKKHFMCLFAAQEYRSPFRPGDQTR